MTSIGFSHVDLRQVIGAVRSGARVSETRAGGGNRVAPFITISREAGAGGLILGRLLAERLTRYEAQRRATALASDTEESPPPVWRCFDRELVEKIAHDNNLSTELVESLENSSHTWIEEFFSGLGHQDRTTSEMAVFRRVVSTVHALAQCGHIILVGLGGVLITRHRKGGIHFRLVAPLEYRVAHLARQDGISLDEARRKVPLLDQNRRAYHHRFWPDEPLVPEMFHLTLNSGLLSEEQMVECILPTLWGPNGI